MEVGRTRRGGPTDGKTTALILTLVAAFLICWAPYHFFAFLEFLFQVRAVRGCFWENFTDLGLQWANFFAFLNSCLNPIIYVFWGRLFRTKSHDKWDVDGEGEVPCVPVAKESGQRRVTNMDHRAEAPGSPRA
ncbi:hypothetical protein CB1_000726062 [Camelus ferus]|nr:hypothetical protein CB1_000726062 [Camelus ferus]